MAKFSTSVLVKNPTIAGAYAFFTLFSALKLFVLTDAKGSVNDATFGPGHLKRFGEGRPVSPVEELTEYPDTRTFFKNYVLASKPVVMRGVGKLSPAFELWRDDYFLSLKIPADNLVTIETKKKENRSQPTVEMHFKDFVKVYNNTEQYLVDPVPVFLKQDVVLPGPLQCEEIYRDKIVEAMMWFSSGGTKSVVHTDSVDNINCLYRGDKELFMIDPHKYRDQVDLDHPEGAYSAMDVDSIDYRKYPGMAEVEFFHVNMTAGDCLFIPFKWIHQVRSYGSNIAVNIWWDFSKNSEVNLDKCTQTFSKSLTINQVNNLGLDGLNNDIGLFKEQMVDLVRHRSITYERLLQHVLGDMNLSEEEKDFKAFKIPLQEIFRLFDRDRDGLMTRKEVTETNEEDMQKIMLNVKNLETLIKAMEEELQKEEAMYKQGKLPVEKPVHRDGSIKPADEL